MNIPKELRYTKDHEWLRVEGGEGVIGLTDYAQRELGDIVFVTLPEVGGTFNQGDAIGTVEAVKAAADIYAPVSGEVIAVNAVLETSAEIVNQSPYDQGWFVRVRLTAPDEVGSLLDDAGYAALIEKEKGEA